MNTFLIVLHVIVSLFLIAVVLLQRGKGAEIGAVFGGGASSTVFGSRGAGNFLTKLTTASAVIFMSTSLALSYLGTTAATDRLFDDPDSIEEPALEQPLFEEIETVPPLLEEPAIEAPAAGTSATGLPALADPTAENPTP
jgi:preprotein translocase subunit SecG